MKALDLLKLATEAYPEMKRFYNDDPEQPLDSPPGLYIYGGIQDSLADAIVRALLDIYKEHGDDPDSALLTQCVKAMEILQQQIGKVRNRLLLEIVSPKGGKELP